MQGFFCKEEMRPQTKGMQYQNEISGQINIGQDEKNGKTN